MTYFSGEEEKDQDKDKDLRQRKGDNKKMANGTKSPSAGQKKKQALNDPIFYFALFILNFAFGFYNYAMIVLRFSCV